MGAPLRLCIRSPLVLLMENPQIDPLMVRIELLRCNDRVVMIGLGFVTVLALILKITPGRKNRYQFNGLAVKLRIFTIYALFIS